MNARILVAVNRLEAADLEPLFARLPRLEAAVRLVHVMPPRLPTRPARSTGSAQPDHEARETAYRQECAFRARLRLERLRVSALPLCPSVALLEPRLGSPVPEVLRQEALHWGATLIVVGHSGWRDHRAGSVVETLRRMAPCPVVSLESVHTTLAQLERADSAQRGPQPTART